MKKIRYSKERLRTNLRMGIFFVAFGVVILFLSIFTYNLEWEGISLEAVGIGQIGAGVSIFIIYFYERTKQYLTLKDGVLIKNTFFTKKVKLSDVKSIREFAGDLKLISEKEEFIIDTQIIEPHSLAELKKEFKIFLPNVVYSTSEKSI